MQIDKPGFLKALTYSFNNQLTIQHALAAGESVFVREFGTFSPKLRAAKIGRNIKKGLPVHIPEHYIPAFKPAREFKEAVAKLPARKISVQ